MAVWDKNPTIPRQTLMENQSSLQRSQIKLSTHVMDTKLISYGKLFIVIILLLRLIHMLYVLHYFIIILLSNFCPDIVNIIQLFSKKMTMQFSWTLCYYEYTQDLVYIINLLYSFKYTQLSPIVKYMHSNIPSTINILYWYTYFIIVSNIFTQKHVVMQCLFLLNVLIKSHINIHTEEKYFKCNKVIMVKYEYLPM